MASLTGWILVWVVREFVMDREVWCGVIHEVAKGRTRLTD